MGLTDLDVKDRRILAALDDNGRQSFQELSNAVGLSKETAIYRVRRLEEKNVISDYLCLVNFAKLGYTGFGVFNRLSHISKEQKKELVDFLLAHPHVYWVGLTGGKFDLTFAILAENVFEFNLVFYEIRNRFGNYIAESSIAIRAELRQSTRNYLLDTKEKKARLVFGQQPEQVKIDELDEGILALLSSHARLPVQEIARMLDKPASTIALRIQLLQKKDVIRGFTTNIKNQNLGLQGYVLLLKLEKMDESLRNRLFSYSLENPCSWQAIETVGAWNFEIYFLVENHEQLQEEISKLRDLFGFAIKDLEFLIMFEDLIFDTYPLQKQKRKEWLGKTEN